MHYVVLIIYRSIVHLFSGFSVEMQSGVAIRDVEIPVLEDVTDEEVEVMSASESKEATPKESKLKVPQK